MAMRSMASATISFGLVSIPVRLYSATESSSSISFNLLHKPPCGSRLKQQYVCIKEEVIVPREEMVKGYEFQKGEYVIFTPEELKELEETATQTVDITEFVPLTKVDPIYFDRAYFHGPETAGDKTYKLLWRATRRAARCTSCWCGRSRTSWSCSSCTTPTRCATSAKFPSVTRRCASRS